MKCLTCGTTDIKKIIYSGVDAFCLGVQTETWCYDCANAFALDRKQKEQKSAQV